MVPSPVPTAATSRFTHPPLPRARGVTLYVDPQHGSDAAGNGSLAAPYASLPPALAATRAAPGSGDVIFVRAGTIYNASTLVITPEDEGLAISAFPGEEAWVSGGVPLEGLAWAPIHVNASDRWPLMNASSVFRDSEVGGPASFRAADALTWEGCSAGCVANATAGGACSAWTWFDLNNGGWSKGCWWRIDGRAPLYGKGGCVSARRQGGANVWAASLAGRGLARLPGLRAADGTRLIRARFPNSDSPERFGFMPPSVFRALSWTHMDNPMPRVQIDLPPSALLRNTTVKMFQTFTAGIGGVCDVFQPAAGYWCSQNVQGGEAGIFSSPTAMQVDRSVLPNLPYAHPETATVHTWREGHWSSWMYEVAGVAVSGGCGLGEACATNFSFSRGGFQGARGDWNGEDSFIENVFEELDAPGEFFYNESSEVLFLFFNATPGTPPPSSGLVATVGKHLFNITGTQAAPVRGVSISGLGLRDTAYTFMDPHGIPSGGDWTLERSAVVFLEGTENVTVEGCVFQRVDGNAVLLSAYNRHANITMNEFVWGGATAVALWGNTEGGDSRLPPGYGFDGSGGNQPRNNEVSYNLCHELGVWEKCVQSSLEVKPSCC